MIVKFNRIKVLQGIKEPWKFKGSRWRPCFWKIILNRKTIMEAIDETTFNIILKMTALESGEYLITLVSFKGKLLFSKKTIIK